MCWTSVHHVLDMQVLLLAGPGVVIGTALTAVFVKYAFPYNWTWIESLLFGAMLSATDPVAVIALLQEVKLSSSCTCNESAYLLFVGVTCNLSRHGNY